MFKPIAAMLVLGTAIGLMLPSGKEDAPAAVPESASKQKAADTFASSATEQPRETLLERKSNGHFYADALVNGQPVHFIVDTGATTVALTEADARRIGNQFSPSEFEIVGQGAGGFVRGKTITLDEIDVDGKVVTRVRGAILQGGNMSLLGQSYLSRISGVQMNGDSMILK
jgi:aspartyl protease family protein